MSDYFQMLPDIAEFGIFKLAIDYSLKGSSKKPLEAKLTMLKRWIRLHENER